MKLPRWLLVSLIAMSSVALLAVPVWLWVEMPRWTAEQLVAAIEAGDLDTAKAILVEPETLSPTVSFMLGEGGYLSGSEVTLRFAGRSVADILGGHQRLEICNDATPTGVYLNAAWKSVDVDTGSLQSVQRQQQRRAFQQAGRDSMIWLGE